MINPEIEREVLKSQISDRDTKAESDISKGIPQPPIQKPYKDGALLIDLPRIDAASSPQMSFFEATTQRCSRRNYTDKPLTLFELAFLLWCTQGIKKIIPGFMRYLKDGSGRNYLRPVPSAFGPFETYVAVLKTQSLKPGIYRYLPLTHQLVWVREVAFLPDAVADTFNNPMQNQNYTKKAAAVFYWSCLPYRHEWLNKEGVAKGSLLVMGHISQNFYLATEALQCGCVVISGYHQAKADALIGVNGVDEFTVHCAAVGHVDDTQRDVYRNLPDFLSKFSR